MTHARDRILTRFLVATMAVTLGAAHAGQSVSWRTGRGEHLTVLALTSIT